MILSFWDGPFSEAKCLFQGFLIIASEVGHVRPGYQIDQWLFLVPLKGGRWHIIPQLAVYTTYILPSGGLYNPYHLLREPETTIELISRTLELGKNAEYFRFLFPGKEVYSLPQMLHGTGISMNSWLTFMIKCRSIFHTWSIWVYYVSYRVKKHWMQNHLHSKKYPKNDNNIPSYEKGTSTNRLDHVLTHFG